jgi:hypothetical protein
MTDDDDCGAETYLQNCSLATAVVLSPVYTAVTWQWVYMIHYESIRDIKALYMKRNIGHDTKSRPHRLLTIRYGASGLHGKLNNYQVFNKPCITELIGSVIFSKKTLNQ